MDYSMTHIRPQNQVVAHLETELNSTITDLLLVF